MSGYGDDAACDGGDFDRGRKLDAALGHLLVLVLADENPLAEGFHGVELGCLSLGAIGHFYATFRLWVRIMLTLAVL